MDNEKLFTLIKSPIITEQTALLGEKAAMACTVAVEKVIGEHYDEQLNLLNDDQKDLKKTSFKLYPYVNKCIKNLKNDNIKLGIVTSGLRERLINSVPNVFLNNFEVIITGEDSKYGKPSKQPFSSGLKKFQ